MPKLNQEICQGFVVNVRITFYQGALATLEYKCFGPCVPAAMHASYVDVLNSI